MQYTSCGKASENSSAATSKAYICPCLDIWNLFRDTVINFIAPDPHHFHADIHCKEPCIPKIWNEYSQKRNYAATVPIFTCERFIYAHDRPAFSAAGNMWTSPGNIEIALRHMSVEIGTEAKQFLEKEYINGIFMAMRIRLFTLMRMWILYFEFLSWIFTFLIDIFFAS